MSFSQIIRQLAILLHVVLVGEEGKPSNGLLISEHLVSNTPVLGITEIDRAAQLRLGQVVHSFENFSGHPRHLNFEVWKSFDFKLGFASACMDTPMIKVSEV